MQRFILEIPQWTGELVFSYSIVKIIMIVLFLLTGILLCVKGYRCFMSALFMIVCGGAAVGAYRISEAITQNLVIVLFLTGSLSFLLICVAYFISMICNFFLEKTKLKTFLIKSSGIWTCVMGGAILIGTVHFFVFKSLILAGFIGIAFAILGYVLQKKNAKKRVFFHTYNDLLKL